MYYKCEYCTLLIFIRKIRGSISNTSKRSKQIKFVVIFGLYFCFVDLRLLLIVKPKSDTIVLIAILYLHANTILTLIALKNIGGESASLF